MRGGKSAPSPLFFGRGRGRALPNEPETEKMKKKKKNSIRLTALSQSDTHEARARKWMTASLKSSLWSRLCFAFVSFETNAREREREREILVRHQIAHRVLSAAASVSTSNLTRLHPFLLIFTLTSSTTSPLSRSSERRAARTAVRDSGLAHGSAIAVNERTSNYFFHTANFSSVLSRLLHSLSPSFFTIIIKQHQRTSKSCPPLCARSIYKWNTGKTQSAKRTVRLCEEG